MEVRGARLTKEVTMSAWSPKVVMEEEEFIGVTRMVAGDTCDEYIVYTIDADEKTRGERGQDREARANVCEVERIAAELSELSMCFVRRDYTWANMRLEQLIKGGLKQKFRWKLWCIVTACDAHANENVL
ncbi:hypothetical protein Tco_1189823 [Tanacetum coccineum]